MKKSKKLASLAIALCAIVSACSNSDELSFPGTNETVNYKLEWAVQQADLATNMFESHSRAASKHANISGVKAVVSQKSRGVSDTLIFVVNYPDDKGFALISAVDPVNPLLAYIPDGHYDPEIGTDNPGFNIFMDAAVEASAEASANITGPLKPDSTKNDPHAVWIVDGKYRTTRTTTLANDILNPKLGTDFRWSQGGIYGDYCSNKTAGCAPLAVASAMTCLLAEDNKTILYRFNFDEENAELIGVYWPDIFAHKYSIGYYDFDCHASNPESVHRFIGKLCRQIGYEGNATYNTNPNRTSMSIANIEKVLKKYLNGYNVSSHTNYTADIPYTKLKNGILLMYGNTDSEGAHEWICDGYKYTQTRTDVMESPIYPQGTNPQYNWTVINSTYNNIYYGYMHWGWGGQCDGWFNGTVFYYQSDKQPYKNLKYCAVTRKFVLNI